MTKLIVGLGNPGPQYAGTRHNLGFLSLQALAGEHKAAWRASAGAQGLLAKVAIDAVACFLLMPTAFMNNSGAAVKGVVSKKGIALEQILVICDDVTLPFGQMRLRPSGSAGGHNGLKSIIGHLGSNQFARLRLGVGAPTPSVDTAGYVLAHFTTGEKKSLPDFINQGLLCVRSWVTEGVESAMNQFNSNKDRNKA